MRVALRRSLICALLWIAVTEAAVPDSVGPGQSGLSEKTKSPVVAIGAVHGDGFAPEELKLAGTRFREKLMQTGAWQIVDVNAQAATAQEAALAQTGCVASSCFAEVGEEMGATHVVLLRLVKTGSLLSAEARLVAVATGHVEKVAVVDADKAFPKFVGSELQKLAEQLVEGGTVAAADKTSKLQRRPAAVLDLEGNGIDSLAARGLTQRLRSELFRTGAFDVMERDEMDDILREQAFQQTLCSGEECAAQVGRLVGVEQMVGGSVSRIGSLYSVSGRVIDVGTGRILRTATVEMDGDLETVLTEGLDDVARSLAGLEPRKRTDWAAWSWFFAGVALAGFGGWMHMQAIDDNDAYKSEHEDVDRLLSLKHSSEKKYWTAFATYGAASLCGVVAVWRWGTPDREIEVRTPNAPQTPSPSTHP